MSTVLLGWTGQDDHQEVLDKMIGFRSTEIG